MKQTFAGYLCILIVFGITGIASAQVDWMPDPNLRQTVREKLNLPRNTPLTVLHLEHLYDLVILESNIADLQGLEHAINLHFLHIGDSRISNLTPLAELVNLEVLKLYGNEIVDISPLDGLVNLKVLGLEGNEIVDISPLSNLTALEHLDLRTNLISDFTPLLHLNKLTHLDIRDNSSSGAGQFLSADPVVIDALRVTVCDFQPPTSIRSVKKRLDGRNYPSVFASQVGIVNTTDLKSIKDFARVDLSFGVHSFHSLGTLSFGESPFGGTARIGNVEALKQRHADVVRENSNMILLVEIRYYDGHGFGLTEDSPYWLRNSDGTIAQRVWYRDTQGNEYSEPLVDFTHPDIIDMIVAQAVAVAKCGLYDGI